MFREQFEDVDYIKAAISGVIVPKLFTYDDILSEYFFSRLAKDITDFTAFKQGRVSRSKMYYGHKLTHSYSTKLRFNDSTYIALWVDSRYPYAGSSSTAVPELSSVVVQLQYTREIRNYSEFVCRAYGKHDFDVPTNSVRDGIDAAMANLFSVQERGRVEAQVNRMLTNAKNSIYDLQLSIG